MIKGFDGKTFLQSNASSGIADHVLGTEHDEGGGGVLQNALDTEPIAGGNFAELSWWSETKIEHHKREGAIVQEHIGRFDGVFGLGAADPKKSGENIVIDGGGIERITSIDERDPFAVLVGAFDEGVEEKGSAGSDARADDLGKGAFGQTALEERIDLREAGGPAVGNGFAGVGRHFDAGKFGGEKLAQLDDISGVG